MLFVCEFFVYLLCRLRSFHVSCTRREWSAAFLTELRLVESADGVQRGDGVAVLAADPSTPHRRPSVDTLGRH